MKIFKGSVCQKKALLIIAVAGKTLVGGVHICPGQDFQNLGMSAIRKVL
ncbi:hypothetical protein [Merdimonas faecis]